MGFRIPPGVRSATDIYLILKTSHMALATLAISGFLLRGYWVFADSKLRQLRATRVLPHVIDALFLGTGIWLVILLNLNPLQHAWLLAIFAGLFAYIVGVALTKSPASWLARNVAAEAAPTRSRSHN